jgi:Uma2 family endonuclease
MISQAPTQAQVPNPALAQAETSTRSASPPQRSSPALDITWDRLPPDYVLPDDPVENLQQPILAAALSDALGENGRIQPEMLMVSNFGLVATVKQKTVVKAPDWLYVPRVNPVASREVRRSYTPYTEGDPIAVVMEFLSQTECGELSARSSYPYGKLYFYERILQVPTYVTFDPEDLSLEVRRLEKGDGNNEPRDELRYQLHPPDEQGRYWIPELNLFLGTWYGDRLGHTIHWLRWWDTEGNLLLWSSERAEIEKQRAESEKQRADSEQARAEAEKQRADAAEAELAELRARLSQ